MFLLLTLIILGIFLGVIWLGISLFMELFPREQKKDKMKDTSASREDTV